MRLYCIDPWEAYTDYVEQHTTEGQAELNDFYKIAKERLQNYNCSFIRKRSMDALEDFEDNSLDFVFIDGNHTFEYVVNDIAEWTKKVRVGGIISGHDYWNSSDGGYTVKGLTETEKFKLCQVKDVVNAWTKANQIKPWFVLNADKCPSFFWVKT